MFKFFNTLNLLDDAFGTSLADDALDAIINDYTLYCYAIGYETLALVNDENLRVKLAYADEPWYRAAVTLTHLEHPLRIKQDESASKLLQAVLAHRKTQPV